MSGYAVVSIALRPPRKCSTLGDGIVIFGVAFVVFFRNLKSSTKIGCGRDSLPVIFTPGGVHSISPCSEWNLIGIPGVCSTFAKSHTKSMCHRPRRNSPSVTDKVPRSEEHTSELQSPCNLVCRLLL